MDHMYHLILILGAFLISLVSIRMPNKVFRWICFIFLITSINEGIIIPLLKRKEVLYNIQFYNAFSLVDMTVWFGIFYILHHKRRYKIFAIAAFGFCMAHSLLELFYLKGWSSFHTDSFRVYDICIIALALFYFYETLRVPYHDINRDPYFWIAAACFLYHALLFVTFTTQAQPDYWSLPNASKFFYILQFTGNTFYYVLLSLSFLICYSTYSRQVRA